MEINKKKRESKKFYFVYLLECKDGSFYTGITNDIRKRIKAHKKGKGSKYVRIKGFRKLLSKKKCKSKSEALREEYRIKKLKKKDKLEWFGR